MEARGRPALVPGESPASVITSSPILSNSGRTPLVLLVLHLLSRAHLAPLAFQPHPPLSPCLFLSLSSVPLPPAISLLSFEPAVSSSYSPFPLRAQQFLIRLIFISQFPSYTLSSGPYCSCKKLFHSQTMNKKNRVRKFHFKHDFAFKVNLTNYRLDSVLTVNISKMRFTTTKISHACDDYIIVSCTWYSAAFFPPKLRSRRGTRIISRLLAELTIERKRKFSHCSFRAGRCSVATFGFQ